ncbi:non-homologous end-joining DNA ligase [Dermacoccus nishinomiyaensis]|uniref:non-homologous end-joining DNA ligase n=1 Tax=Dermacoccus nishinomiyaensis TaxID=1274 RepID=UPI001F50832B|nr:non-homologous end-joining DNA ligase [Dermacoccus nishinomiyaensis]MCI0152867.1 non-homologous end-joining DNA ligase [Dermacoccus nishinomiyaensis]
MASTAVTLEIPGPDGEERTVRVSSPDRVVYPDDGVTKLDLVEYVLAVAEPFLRWSGDRPVALERYPKGLADKPFFSKNPPKGAPSYARSVMCTYPSARAHEQLLLDEPAMLAWCVQMNTVTFHPWPVRAENNDNPDELRIDLDPQPGRDFADAVEAAFALKELMESLGFTPFVKTSGNRGVHVYARIAPTREFLDVRHGVIGIARELERRLPDLVTTEWWKELRGEKVFVDFNQANRDRTIAAAYSPRPLPGAPVSMPVAWSQLRDITPPDFTVRTVPGIVAADGDEWAPAPGESMNDHVGDVDAAIALWDADVERGLPELPFPPDYPKMPGEPPRVQPSRAKKDAP